MYISVKSEVDSRILVYPLMRALWSYGSILLITNNKQCRRLIDDLDTNTCRNMTILVDEVSSADEVLEAYGVAADDYNFVILDNMPSIEYDVCLVALGALHSPEFDEMVKDLLEGDEADKVYIFQYGKSLKKDSTKSRNTMDSANKSGGRGKEVSSFDDYVEAEVRAEKKNKRTDVGKPMLCKFPSYEDIECVEGEHRFYMLDEGIVKAFYTVFKQALVVYAQQFRKEVTKKDEYSGYLKSRNTIGDE